MPRFFFPVDYDGFHCADDNGEVFPSAGEAENHAKIVAAELSRGNIKDVIVFVVTPDGTRLAEATSVGEYADRGKKIRNSRL